MIPIFLVAFGLVLGSFVNALIWRLHAQDEVRDKLQGPEDPADKKTWKKPSAKQAAALRKELVELSMVHGRSMCSKCRHPLAPKDLLPFFSWLSLGGKCRYCRQPIEDPPIIEVVVPLLFVISYWLWPLSLSGYGGVAFVAWLLISVGFVALSAYDIRWFLLPDKIVWPLVAIALVQVALHASVFGGGWPVVWQAAGGVVIDSGIFFVLYQVSRGKWIGGGDVKLGIVLGLLAGGILPALLVIFIASLLGTLASFPLLLKRTLKPKTLIPFGPFLIAAGYCVVLSGHHIVHWLNGLLLLQI